VGFIVSNKDTVVSFGGLNLTTILFFIGLIFTSVLVIKRVLGSFIIGISFISVLSVIISYVGAWSGWLDKPIITMPEEIFALPAFDVFLKLDILGALTIGMILPIFSLLFVDLFDSLASFVGVAEAAKLVDKDGNPTNIGKALVVDAFSTTISGLFGTSSGTVYVESAAGIEEGGRTGLTSVVTGLLFIPFMFLSPLLSFIPAAATAPVLVLVGVFMAKPLMDIDWKNFEESIPAFLAVIIIPLTFSITQGVVWGFLVYTLIKLLLGKAKEIHWIIYGIDFFALISLISPMFVAP